MKTIQKTTYVLELSQEERDLLHYLSLRDILIPDALAVDGVAAEKVGRIEVFLRAVREALA